MPLFNEETLITQIRNYEASITGVKESFGFAQNPDTLSPGMLPCALHYSPGFRMETGGHHNIWRVEIDVVSVLFVAARESAGGRLKFLENETIPFLHKWRQKFTDSTNIRTILNATGAQRFSLATGVYGAGQPALTHNGVEYIGAIFTFSFLQKAAGS